MFSSAILLSRSKGVVSAKSLLPQMPQISVRSIGCTLHILPSHAPTKTSRTWKFEAFYPNAWNKYYYTSMLTHMQPLDPSPLQFLQPTRIPHECGLRTSSNNSHHKLVSGQWIKQFASSLHMPRRKHQEHGSLESSILLLRTSTVANQNNMQP